MVEEQADRSAKGRMDIALSPRLPAVSKPLRLNIFCFQPSQHFPFTQHSIHENRLYTYILLLGAFTELRKTTTSSVMSVCPHGTTRLPPEGFS
jgi:hypothetical protein